MINEYSFKALTWGGSTPSFPQKCLKMLKEFHFGIASELVCVFCFITLQLHLIFNPKIVSCLINHFIHQTWLWMTFGCFQKWNSSSKLKDLCYWSSLRKVTSTLKNSRGVPDIFWYWKNLSHYFAAQSHTFSCLLEYCFGDETQTYIN